HLRRGKRRHRKIKAAQAQRRQPDQHGDERARGHRGKRGERQRHPIDRGKDASRVGADAEERLLAERHLAGDQQQIRREREEREQPDVRQDADRVLVHRVIQAGRSASSTKISRYAIRSRSCGPKYHWLWASTSPSTRPPATAPGSDPRPPSIIASMPLTVDHMPSIGVTCSWLAAIRNPASPPIAEASA